MFLILLGTAAFLYYLYFKQKYGYWERRGELQFIEFFATRYQAFSWQIKLIWILAQA